MNEINKTANPNDSKWYVMRDLKRSNAKDPAWKILSEMEFEVFTPMHWKLFIHQGKRNRKLVPVISDLLFVHSDKIKLDEVVRKTPTLQFRFTRKKHCEPITIKEKEMTRFINAVGNFEKVKYYTSDELNSGFKGKRVRIIGGILNGYEGLLLSVRGSKTKRLLVELPDLLTAGVEVNPEYIEIIGNEEA